MEKKNSVTSGGSSWLWFVIGAAFAFYAGVKLISANSDESFIPVIAYGVMACMWFLAAIAWKLLNRP